MHLQRSDIRGAVLQAAIRPGVIGGFTFARSGVADIHPKTTGRLKALLLRYAHLRKCYAALREYLGISKHIGLAP